MGQGHTCPDSQRIHTGRCPSFDTKLFDSEWGPAMRMTSSRRPKGWFAMPASLQRQKTKIPDSTQRMQVHTVLPVSPHVMTGLDAVKYVQYALLGGKYAEDMM